MYHNLLLYINFNPLSKGKISFDFNLIYSIFDKCINLVFMITLSFVIKYKYFKMIICK